MSDPIRDQRLVDSLQAIALRAQRIDATTRQQAEDVAALLAATQRAVAIVKPPEQDR